MGFLITFEPTDKKSRQKMLDFMSEYLIPANEIFDSVEEPHDITSEGVLTEHVYGTENGEIGFYKHAGCPDPCYNYASTIVRWMAIQIGKRKIFEKHNPDVPVPYGIYDDHEFMPIYFESDEVVDEDRLSYVKITDHKGYMTYNGILSYTEGRLGSDDPRVAEMNTRIKEQIERLDNLWKKQVLGR